MAKEIKQKIVLEGEKQYNQAIKEAQRNLRTLKSELKAETAELGKNATEQQKAEAKAKSLKQQIAEQEKIVKTLRAALAEAKAQYGENADEVAKWEVKLNGARATLANMKSDLDGVGEGMKKSAQDAAMGTVAAKSYADSIGKIADAGAAVSDRLEGIFSGMVDLVKASIGEVWADLLDLAARANEWGDIAGIWNTDAANVEKWSRATKSATGDFNALLSSVQKINDLNDKQQKKVAEWSGVSGVNYTDRWSYAVDVLQALSELDYDKQLQASEEIFGAKRAGGIIDLLNDWQGIQDALNRFDAENGGVGLNNEQLQNMVELDVRVHTLQETWQAFIDSFEAEHFANLALDLTGNAQRILDDLIKYMDTGDDADLEQLEKDITEFFDRIKQAIENAAGKLDEAGKKLQESDNGIVKLIGKAMSDLATALQWLSKDENIDKVVHGFEVLLGLWTAGKFVSALGRIASLAANIKTIMSFNAGTALAGAAGGAGSTIASIGSGIASALAGVTLAVSVAAMAVPVVSLLKSLIVDGKWPDWLPNPNKSLGETVLPDADKETQEAVTKALEQNAPGVSKKDALQWGVKKLLGGGVKEATPAEEDAMAAALAGLPQPYVPTGSGPSSPHIKMDATAEQQAAAEAFWDMYREDKYTDEEFDKAWDALVTAFGGEGSTAFERMNTLLDKLIEEHSSAENDTDYNPANWMDIPASWWQNPAGDAGNTGDGISSSDLAGFRGLPANLKSAAQSGVAAGIRGLRVEIDGHAAGRILAPYVSAEIASQIQ